MLGLVFSTEKAAVFAAACGCGADGPRRYYIHTNTSPVDNAIGSITYSTLVGWLHPIVRDVWGAAVAASANSRPADRLTVVARLIQINDAFGSQALLPASRPVAGNPCSDIVITKRASRHASLEVQSPQWRILSSTQSPSTAAMSAYGRLSHCHHQIFLRQWTFFLALDGVALDNCMLLFFSKELKVARGTNLLLCVIATP